MYQHKHKYVYEYLVKKHLPERGYVRCHYTLLTDIDDPNCKQNRILLEQGFRLGYGYMPKHVRYQYDNALRK